MLQDMPANRESHDHHGHEYTDDVERDCRGGMTTHKEHDDERGNEGDGNRACECSPYVSLDAPFRDHAYGDIPPLHGLRVLVGSHGRGGEQQHGEYLIRPVEDEAGRQLAEADVREIAHQRPAERAVEDAELD